MRKGILTLAAIGLGGVVGTVILGQALVGTTVTSPNGAGWPTACAGPSIFARRRPSVPTAVSRLSFHSNFTPPSA